VANTQDNDIHDEGTSPPEPHPDLLAAVVLHVLVTEGREGLSTDAVARACERDPAEDDEREEVETALKILIRDDLALCRTGSGEDGSSEGPLFAPTQAAIRAAELSF
jgi:hypothetical protein